MKWSYTTCRLSGLLCRFSWSRGYFGVLQDITVSFSYSLQRILDVGCLFLLSLVIVNTFSWCQEKVILNREERGSPLFGVPG